MEFPFPKVEGTAAPVRAVLMRFWPTRTNKVQGQVLRPDSGGPWRWVFAFEEGYAAIVFEESLQASGLEGSSGEVEFEFEAGGEPPRFYGGPVLVVGPDEPGFSEIERDQWLLGGPPLLAKVSFLDLGLIPTGMVDPRPIHQDPGLMGTRLELMLKDQGRRWVGGEHFGQQMVMWEIDAWSMYALKDPQFLEPAYQLLAGTISVQEGAQETAWSEAVLKHFEQLGCGFHSTSAAIHELTGVLLARGEQLVKLEEDAAGAELQAANPETLKAVSFLFRTSFEFWLGGGLTLYAPRLPGVWAVDAAYSMFSAFARGLLRTYNREAQDSQYWVVLGGQPDSSYFPLFSHLALAQLEESEDPDHVDFWLAMLGSSLAAQSEFFSVFGPGGRVQGRREQFTPLNIDGPRHHRDRVVRAERSVWPTVQHTQDALRDGDQRRAFVARARMACAANERYSYFTGPGPMGGNAPWRGGPGQV